MKGRDQNDIEKLKETLEEKNSYLSLYRKDEIKEKEKEEERTLPRFAYDTAKIDLGASKHDAVGVKFHKKFAAPKESLHTPATRYALSRRWCLILVRSFARCVLVARTSTDGGRRSTR